MQERFRMEPTCAGNWRSPRELRSNSGRFTEPDGCTAKEQKTVTEAAAKPPYNQGCLAEVGFTIRIPRRILLYSAARTRKMSEGLAERSMSAGLQGMAKRNVE